MIPSPNSEMAQCEARESALSRIACVRMCTSGGSTNPQAAAATPPAIVTRAPKSGTQ